jgi:hypothetical protein
VAVVVVVVVVVVLVVAVATMEEKEEEVKMVVAMVACGGEGTQSALESTTFTVHRPSDPLRPPLPLWM